MTRYTYLIPTPTGAIYGITLAESEEACRAALVPLHGKEMAEQAEIELAPKSIEPKPWLH